MKIAIGSDHAGFDLKESLKKYIESMGNKVTDFGPETDARTDYPDYAHPVAEAVQKGEFDLAVLICGSGNGINMSANKHQGIRAALCWEPELAALARQHNNANILSLPARFIEEQTAKDCVKAFLTNQFEGGRHATRVEKIAPGSD